MTIISASVAASQGLATIFRIAAVRPLPVVVVRFKCIAPIPVRTSLHIASLQSAFRAIYDGDPVSKSRLMDIEKRTLLGVSATIVKASIAATAVGVAGCATGPARFGVTYDSFPQGATLVCDGAVMGYTPATLYYKVSELQGYLLLSASNCTANWASGAKRAYEDFRWEKFGNGVTVTSARPDVPGLQQDMDFALSAQHLQAQQQALQLQQQRQRQAQQQDLQQLQLQHQALQPMAAPSSATKNCKKVGDLSGQIYQFQYACPYGYLQSYP